MLKYIDISSRYVGRLALRITKRLFLLFVGIAITYLIAWRIFPAFDESLPFVAAIFATYLLSAYIVLPTGIRVLRLWYRPDHIPHFVTTPDGFNCDPVNIGFVGTKHQLKTVLKKSGWHEADKKTIKTTFKFLVSFFFKRPYPNAPFSSLYLFGRKQDLGFQKHVPKSWASRHHVRLWACAADVHHKFTEHVLFWTNHLEPDVSSKLLWVGAAIKDEGFGFIKYHGQITHSVDSDTNAERDYIVQTLQEKGLVKEVIKVKAGEETKVSNRVIGNHMISDGELHICVIK